MILAFSEKEEITFQDKKYNLFKKNLIPTEPLLEGEQFAFHFDAGKCIGCESCVVACNEQNNNPAVVNWRRVGEIEAGTFPLTKRFFLSMGCNHCLEPSCMKGCPTDSYIKDLLTGIVKHNADTCIGCGYCQWNCPYGVPQFNPERKIVTKCDMCYGRITKNQNPICAESCPENAITIEKINVDEWRKDHEQADSPGLPNSDFTVSTTKITLPNNLKGRGTPVNELNIKPEHGHPTLVAFLIFSQLGVGGFISLWLLDIINQFYNTGQSLHAIGGLFSGAMLFISLLATVTAMFHLGRPIFAYRALKMWKKSWLSREVLLFSVFSFFALTYTGLWINDYVIHYFEFSNILRTLLGTIVAISGVAGILSSAYIYMVPARPSWNSPNTLLGFLMTAFLLGPSFSSIISLTNPFLDNNFLLINHVLIIFVSLIVFLLIISSIFFMNQNHNPGLKGTATLLTTRYKPHLTIRIVSLFIGGFVLPVLILILLAGGYSYQTLLVLSIIAFTLLLSSEVIGRYLFFTSVVPQNMAGNYFAK